MLLIRKKAKNFKSIENVFQKLNMEIDYPLVELPYHSTGIINRIKNTLFILKSKASFVHITGHDHYVLAFGLNKKSILTIHDIEMINRSKGVKKFLLKLFWFDLPLKHVDVVTTISEFTKNEILRITSCKKPIVVIPNPLSINLSYSPKQFNSECPLILQIGTKENKNIFRLIEALKNIKCKLLIVGQLSSKIEKELINSKINYEVKYNLSEDNLVNAYRNADIVSFVSTYEGFGLPIIEAQAIGRVVLTSSVSSMPEVAGGAALLVDPFSVNEIREGILKLIQDESTRNSLIAAGLENVKRYEVIKIAAAYKKQYDLLLKTD